MQTFCTIITADYFPKAVVLYKSIRKYNKEMTLYVFIADNNPAIKNASLKEGLKIITIADIKEYPLVDSLYKKYAHINIDNFRWSMKPILASYLLNFNFDKVIYTDCDMFFFNDYNFLFADLEKDALLLTANWNNTNPSINKNGFISNFTHGIFSAGFFAASKSSLPALNWWANACHFMMGSHIQLGIQDDQRYLDILPVIFENAKVIRHRGCNIGAWNFEESRRTLVEAQVAINGEYPIIFIHFDEMLISTILKGHDALLKPYLDKYQQSFQEEGYKISDFIKKTDLYANPNFLLRMKWKFKLRTRVKTFLYKLAESL